MRTLRDPILPILAWHPTPRVDKNTGTWRAGGVSAGIQGKADPDADALQGTTTKVTKSRDGRIVRTQIYEWDLRR